VVCVKFYVSAFVGDNKSIYKVIKSENFKQIRVYHW